MTKFTSREFNKNISRARKAAAKGPVFITDRGRPAHVLLSIGEYQRLVGPQGSILDRLGMPAGVENVEVEFPGSPEQAPPIP